ncbi:MAG: ligase-associated DNA damage response exonuclease [Chitinophagaceae bacterium]|nr:ligase-associated DNA damage response exonuclease [Chitinophagaceae bacterium]
MLIDFTDKGLYCSAGNFYLDPWKPVEKAVITHGHSDHARWGSQQYLCHHYTLPILKLRLGENNYQTIGWNEAIDINGVKLSLHPAGHIIGSSQVRVEHKGEVWVISGDYKTENDGISGVFEPVKCHTFVTESTFGLPIYKWKQQSEIFSNIRNWILDNQSNGKASVLIAYSLGKAQRVLRAVKEVTGNIFAHGAVYNMHQTLTNAGILAEGMLPEIKRVVPEMPKETFRNAVIIAPPSAESSPWIKKFTPYSLGICSGWMRVRGNQRRKNADEGFVLSDHCDWPGLLTAVEATGAQRVFVTHGFQSVFSRYLNEAGIEAAEIKTEYGTEEEEAVQELTNNTAEQVATDE